MRNVVADSGFFIALFDETDDRKPLDFQALWHLARKYADQPMDLGDASVVQLANSSGIREVLTADRRGFPVYRMGRKVRFVDVLEEQQT